MENKETKMRTYTSDFAKGMAIRWHNEVNQKYGGYLPYSYHLNLVATIGAKYISLIPEEDRELVIAACWLHDTLEDCHVSYNDLKQHFDEELAEVVYALTNEKGRTRKDRANDAYYQGIKGTKYATYVKMCDRLANVLFSCMFGSKQFEMYRKENKHFVRGIYLEEYDVMFADLEHLFNTKQFGFETHV